MKKQDFCGNDPGLNAVLREWNVSGPLPPRFREQVWQRIARSEASGRVNFREEFQDCIARLLARPSLAVGYAVILLLAGVAAGYWQARAAAQRASETLSSRYVQMLDPYQMPRR